MLTTTQDTHLILKNNTALMLIGGIDTSVGLSIYGQPPANGETTGKLTVNEYSNIGGCIGCGGNFIVNGGDITVNASFSVSDLPDIFGIPDGSYSVMVVGDLTANGGKLTVNQPSGTNYGIFVSGDLTVNGGSITVNGTPASTGPGHSDNWDICAQTLHMQSGTVTGSVLAHINDLNMTGGTLKFKEGSILASVAASPLTAPLMDGCAYFQISLSGYPSSIVENEVGFVTLDNLTALNAEKNNTTIYYVRKCEHSAESGICDYCGKNLSPAPSSSSSSAPTYTVTAPATENGSVNISPKNAKKGTAVTITVTPDSGYTLETLTVTDKNGKEIELTNNGDGTYTFNMPGGEVEVTTTFMEDNSMLNLFVDVTADKYYYDAVLWAAKNGITGGIDENHFGPDLSCTRAQLVTFLWRAAGCPVVNYAMNFTDVGDSYYSEAVRWAASLGIVDGYGNDLFGSNDTITREQMATILYRFAMAMGMDTTQGGMAAHEYSDYESISSYAVDAMQWAVNAGIMQGYDNNLMPAQPCTRAQIVTMLYRLLGE